MRHTISVLVSNEFGVLSRISGLFSGRGFNIESLSVAETLDPDVSRMTIVSSGDEKIIEQITKQLNKLVSVVKVHDLTGEEHIDRRLVLLKVKAEPDTRAEILGIVEIFGAKVLDIGAKSYTIEVTGGFKKVEAFIELLKPFGVKEMASTGAIAMARSSKAIETSSKKTTKKRA